MQSQTIRNAPSTRRCDYCHAQTADYVERHAHHGEGFGVVVCLDCVNAEPRPDCPECGLTPADDEQLRCACCGNPLL